MNERDIKLMRFRSNFHRLYSTTVLLDVIVIPVLIYFSYLSRQAKNDNLLFAFITLIALIAIISILVSKYAKKHGFEKSPIPPYTIQLSPCNLEEFKNTISFFPENELFENAYCAYLKKRKIICFLSVYFPSTDSIPINKKMIKWKMSETIDVAVSRGIVPKNVYSPYKTGICYLYIFDELNEDMLSVMNENAANDHNTLVSSFELNTGILRMQALWGGNFGDDVVYRFMVKTLTESISGKME